MEKTILEPGSTIYQEMYKQLKEASFVPGALSAYEAIPMPPPVLDWRDQNVGNVVEKSDENTVA